MPGATIADFHCSVCGSRVGYVELYPAGVPRAVERGPESGLRDVNRRWTYADNGDRMGDAELSSREFARQAKAVRDDQPEPFLRLYCPECQLVYCFDHWQVAYSPEESPYSYSSGVCPKGHGRTIDSG